MTVRELIEKLKTFSPDDYVVVDGYEEGCDDPIVTTISLILDANWTSNGKARSWAGKHDYAAADDLAAREVVRIGRRE
jgi:hypothetical protein